ncbi:MAG: YfcE family phosphodiesterase [Anaerolineales bacterium]|nr:YfcE family phosphodiesterase [Anaerolineales bacterium]
MEQGGKLHRIGVISDTHGILREDVLQALEGSELILHAGDVGKEEILDALEQIAPVKVVRGNMDRESWTRKLPLTQAFEVKGTAIFMIHDLNLLDMDLKAGGFELVVHGHTHKPSIEDIDGVLYLNPGSAGPHRPSNPVSLAQVEVDENGVRACFIFLEG